MSEEFGPSSGTVTIPPDGGSLYFRGGWYTEEAIESIIESEVKKRIVALKAELNLKEEQVTDLASVNLSIRAENERLKQPCSHIDIVFKLDEQVMNLKAKLSLAREALTNSGLKLSVQVDREAVQEVVLMISEALARLEENS